MMKRNLYNRLKCMYLLFTSALLLSCNKNQIKHNALKIQKPKGVKVTYQDEEGVEWQKLNGDLKIQYSGPHHLNFHQKLIELREKNLMIKKEVNNITYEQSVGELKSFLKLLPLRRGLCCSVGTERALMATVASPLFTGTMLLNNDIMSFLYNAVNTGLLLASSSIKQYKKSRRKLDFAQQMLKLGKKKNLIGKNHHTQSCLNLFRFMEHQHQSDFMHIINTNGDLLVVPEETRVVPLNYVYNPRQYNRLKGYLKTKRILNVSIDLLKKKEVEALIEMASKPLQEVSLLDLSNCYYKVWFGGNDLYRSIDTTFSILQKHLLDDTIILFAGWSKKKKFSKINETLLERRKNYYVAITLKELKKIGMRRYCMVLNNHFVKSMDPTSKEYFPEFESHYICRAGKTSNQLLINSVGYKTTFSLNMKEMEYQKLKE